MQNRLIPAFHYALKPGGVLFLTPSESIGDFPELFKPLSRKWKFYRASGTIASARAVMSCGLLWTKDHDTKGPEEVTRKIKETNFVELTQKILLQSYAPASVVTDLRGSIIFVHGDTGRYLRPAPGQASLNVVDMARDGLQLELRVTLNSASQGTTTLCREVSFKSDGALQVVNLNVRPLHAEEGGEKLLLVSFLEAVPPAAVKPGRSKKAVIGEGEAKRVDELKRELAYSRENLQATIEEQQASNEEQQASNEELKSTNEELKSTNEELQSTNEELETSKEELQSVNEELITMNAELQGKIEQLAEMQNDMKNLLDNVNIGTIFLDEDLTIRRFTREATQVYRLAATDVGRPLNDIKSNVAGDDLVVAAQAVLDTLTLHECEVHSVDGASYLVRIQPYRTLNNVIQGVVLTFTDISERVQAEAAVQAALEQAQSIVDTVREPLVLLDAKLKVTAVSRSFYRYFQTTAEETLGQRIYDLGNRQWDIPKLRELLEKILQQSLSFDDYEVEHDFPGIGQRKMLLNARRIVGADNSTRRILLAMEALP